MLGRSQTEHFAAVLGYSGGAQAAFGSLGEGTGVKSFQRDAEELVFLHPTGP